MRPRQREKERERVRVRERERGSTRSSKISRVASEIKRVPEGERERKSEIEIEKRAKDEKRLRTTLGTRALGIMRIFYCTMSRRRETSRRQVGTITARYGGKLHCARREHIRYLCRSTISTLQRAPSTVCRKYTSGRSLARSRSSGSKERELNIKKFDVTRVANNRAERYRRPGRTPDAATRRARAFSSMWKCATGFCGSWPSTVVLVSDRRLRKAVLASRGVYRVARHFHERIRCDARRSSRAAAMARSR